MHCQLRPTYFLKQRSRLPLVITKHLDIIEATRDSVRAAIDQPSRLGELLCARVPTSWPPELLDTPALEWVLRWQDNPANQSAFGFYWIVLRDAHATHATPTRTLVGVFGFKGMPDTDGTVELGYGVVAEFQRRGFATEAVRAMLARAFAHAGVRRVTAETLPGLAPSIGVLEKCGFRFSGDGSEPGVIRFEILRGEETRPSKARSDGLSVTGGTRIDADRADQRR